MNINVTFKQSEKTIYEFAKEHSSPAAYIKDLINEDYKRKQSDFQQNSIQNHPIPKFDFLD